MDYYSKKFIQSSLIPLWRDNEIETRIKLNLYPYGKTEALNDTDWLNRAHPENNFRCEHGTAECFKTALENCAISHLNDPDLYLPFIACFVERVNVSQAMAMGFIESQDACFSSEVISDTMMDDIQKCTNSKEGLILMSTAGKATNNLQNPSQAERKWANLPWVVVNGHRSSEAELDGKAGAEGYLLKVICEYFAYPLPIGCVLDVNVKSNKSIPKTEQEPFIADEEQLEWEMKEPERDEPFIAEDEKNPEEPFVGEDEKVNND